MLAYLARRILIFIPTLILVSILTFVLSQLVQGDKTSTLLSLEGLEADMQNYDDIYERRYVAEGLDKPSFYIGLKPNYVSISANRIVDPRQRYFYEKLHSKRYNSQYAQSLWEQLSTEKNDIAKQWKAEANPTAMKAEIVNKDAPLVSEDLATMVLEEGGQRSSVHYPVLRWNGLDNQYHDWMSNFVRGDLGVSIIDGRPSSQKIGSALRWTLLILVLNILISLLIAVPYGLYTGLNTGSTFDKWSGSVLFGIYAMPSFWIATLLVVYFTTSEYGMKILPSVGIWYQGKDTSFWQMIASKWTLLILPLVILVFKDVAYLGRLIRDTVAGEAKKLYALTSKAKGTNEKRHAYRHILPNALGPAITLAVGAIPGAIGGSLLMEVIFNIPGMGRLMYTSIAAADWDVVFPIVILTALMTVVWYLIGDILISWLNPKVKL